MLPPISGALRSIARIALRNLLTGMVILVIFAAFGGASGQAVTVTPEMVTASAAGGSVRFIAPGRIVRLRLEVVADSGDSIFDVTSKGNVFDWNLLDGSGQRVADGSYVCVITVKALDGALSQRIAPLKVDAGTALLQLKAHLSAAQEAAIGPLREGAFITVIHRQDTPSATVVAHDGKDGQVTATTGDLTFRTGDVFSGAEKERMRITDDGRVGIGIDKPEAELDVAGVIMGRKGFTFSNGTTLNVNEKGGLSLTKPDGTSAMAPNAAGTGTINRLAKWNETGGAGTLTDSFALDTGTGLQLTAAPSNAIDTNVIFTSANDRTTGVIASSTSAFLANNGPYFALRGNTYNALGGQRGLFSISAGNVAAPTGSEGTILFFTGNDQLRMVVKPSGNVGIGTSNPTTALDVIGSLKLSGSATAVGTINAGTINAFDQVNLGGSRLITGSFSNLSVGFNTGDVFGGSENSYFGYGAGRLSAPSTFNNSFFGALAGYNVQSDVNGAGRQNSFFGSFAGYSFGSGKNNSIFGSGNECNTPNSLGASDNSFFGVGAGCGLSNGTAIDTANGNTFVGRSAGTTTVTGSNNSAFGYLANIGDSAMSGSTAIGYRAIVTQPDSLVLGAVRGLNGSGSLTRVGIGTSAPPAMLSVVGSQPNFVAAGDGPDALPALSVVGGKGADTQSTTANGGGGSTVSLTGGNGGDTAPTGTGLGGRGGDVTITAGNAGFRFGTQPIGRPGRVTIQAGAGGNPTGSGLGVNMAGSIDLRPGSPDLPGTAYGNVNIAPSGGRVGIGLGTALPVFRLHMKVDGQDGINLQHTGVGAYPQVRWTDPGGVFKASIGYGYASGEGMRFSVNQADRLVIDNSGLIRAPNGIFIANPSTVFITSPNGACWGITVNNTGGLGTFPLTCP